MGDQYVNNVNLYLQATGPKAIVPPYTVVATAAAYGNVTGFWNWEVGLLAMHGSTCLRKVH